MFDAGEQVKTALSNEIASMIRDILDSHMPSIEKLFLSIEWCLREQKPYELYETTLIDIEKKAKAIVDNLVPLKLRKAALRESKEIFKTKDYEKLFSILTALSYYTYISDEFVYDQNSRTKLLSKISELGFELSEIERLNVKWTHVAGSPEELFNKIFRK